MKSISLSELARRQCSATRLNMKGFIREFYHVNDSHFRRIASGQKSPSQKFLRDFNNAHVRLFPTEPVFVEIPNHPVLIPLGHHTPTSNN